MHGGSQISGKEYYNNNIMHMYSYVTTHDHEPKILYLIHRSKIISGFQRCIIMPVNSHKIDLHYKRLAQKAIMIVDYPGQALAQELALRKVKRFISS